MIGKIYSILTPYYDSATKKHSMKCRPALIISNERNNDYTILPLSTISRKENIDCEYDIKVDISIYTCLGLKKDCYIRTHKQQTAHKAEIGLMIGDLKANYPELFDDVMLHLAQFNEELFNRAVI